MTRLVAYVEVAAELLVENPALPDILQLKAALEVPTGYKLGQRYVGDSDEGPHKKVVCWDVLDVRPLA